MVIGQPSKVDKIIPVPATMTSSKPYCWMLFTLFFAVAFVARAGAVARAGVVTQAEVVAPTENEGAAPAQARDKLPLVSRFTDKLSPLRSAQGFMRLAAQGDYGAAAAYLDLRNLPERVAAIAGEQLARQLYVVIARKVKMDIGTLSDDPEGALESGVPSYRDILGRIASDNGDVILYLQRVPDGEGGRIWKISNASVAHIPDLYRQYGYGSGVEFVRELMPRAVFFGTELFKWVIALLCSLAATGVWYLLAVPLGRFFGGAGSGAELRVNRYLHGPVAVFIFITVGYAVLRDLGMGVTPSRLGKANTVIILVFAWLLFATADLVRDLYAARLRARGRESALMLVGPMSSSFKMIIGALAFVTWLDNVGINVTALLAGLGVGGLAVALVLQRPLEDILGAISLYTQQPVSVGQFCVSGETRGIIEEIGIRTTKIRTIEKTLVAIPNALMARASIENISERPQILHKQVLRLALDTPHATLTSALESLRDVLRGEAVVDQESWRIRLIAFGDHAIEVEVFAFIATTDWPLFLENAERINLAMLRVLETQGVAFAPPRYY